MTSTNIYGKEAIYYVYAYLRSEDSPQGKAGTPYYIGKGKGNRAYAKHTVYHPKDKTLIIFLETNLTELGAYALERRLIAWWGRLDLKTGCLHNLTNGGPNNDGKVVSYKQRRNHSNRMKGRTNPLLAGTSPAMLSNGKRLGRVSTKDPRWETGEIKHPCAGISKKNFVAKKGKISAKCSKTKEPLGWIDKEDPRWATGEIIHIRTGELGTKNIIPAKLASTGEKIGGVPKDDPRWATGEIVHTKKGVRKREE